LILESRKLYPKDAGKFYKSEKRWFFKNGSLIEFGYCDAEGDVSKYQSAEYDVIRFDEITHFTEFQYTYLISRIRGANIFPKQIKSSGNPGGIGHSFIKNRFIDKGKWGEKFEIEQEDGSKRSFLFIPALVTENHFLINSDPSYIQRLNQLPETERKRLRDGDWDIFEGRYFPEFSRTIHCIQPFAIPNHWQRFLSMDYGLDMLACLWWAVDEQGQCYIYRELYEPNLNLSQAARRVLECMTYKDGHGQLKEEIYSYIVASPDLWNRRQEHGFSGNEIMIRAGLKNLIRADNSRIAGWRAVKEFSNPYKDEMNKDRGKIAIFDGCCPNLVRCLPLLQHDKHNPEDVSDNPHELTEEEMDTLQFSDEPGAPAAAKRSFREQLDKLIAEGQTFPCFFASTEY
jgi:hypothetical protein